MAPARGDSLLLSLRNAGETLAISFPTVVDAALGRVTRDVCDARLERWAGRVVAHAAIDVHVEGREHFDATRSYLVMSNHQSHYDVPVLFHVLGANLRMVAKKELFAVPIFGQAMREAGFVCVDRANREAAIRGLAAAKELLARGASVWIAPEGTRSRTGELGAFKKGGFVLALDTNLPILPVAISGTRDVLAATAIRSTPGRRVTVSIQPPIELPTLDAGADRASARDALMTRVRESIARGLERER